MTFDQLFVSNKLKELDDYLREVKDFFKLADEEILAHSANLHIAERLLQLCVDVTLDVNHHLIKELNLKSSEDLQSTFYTLGENNILPKDFAYRLAPVVGLKNRVIHRYDKLDKGLFI